MDVVVVVPTARETSLAGFLDAWRDELAQATILVIEDGPERTSALGGANVQRFARCDIEDELGDAAWIIPPDSGCIRSFGCWRAHQADSMARRDRDGDRSRRRPPDLSLDRST